MKHSCLTMMLNALKLCKVLLRLLDLSCFALNKNCSDSREELIICRILELILILKTIQMMLEGQPHTECIRQPVSYGQ